MVAVQSVSTANVRVTIIRQQMFDVEPTCGEGKDMRAAWRL